MTIGFEIVLHRKTSLNSEQSQVNLTLSCNNRQELKTVNRSVPWYDFIQLYFIMLELLYSNNDQNQGF